MSQFFNKDSSRKQYPSDVWGIIQENLSDLCLEYKSTSGTFQRVTKESQAPPKTVIPKGEQISIHRVSVPSRSNKANGGSGGVNHLNLIQIKGNPAHSWQPRLQDNGKILRPDLTGLQMNLFLLKKESTK